MGGDCFKHFFCEGDDTIVVLRIENTVPKSVVISHCEIFYLQKIKSAHTVIGGRP